MIRLFIPLIFLVFSSSAFATKYYVGVSKTNITPKKSVRPEVCMGGYGQPFQKCGLTEVNDRLSARTIAFSDKHTTMVVTSVDAPGLSKSIIGQVKDRIVDRFGIPASHIFIAATHSHSSPDLQGVWGGSSPEYQEFAVNKITRSIRRALRNQEPARIFASTTNAPVENRRGYDVVDDSVNILDIFSRHTKERIATLVNMSAHPTIVPPENIEYSAGYVHYLRETVEDELGGTTVFINGAVGDAQAATNEMRGLDVAEDYGELVGDRIIDAVDHRTKVRGDLLVRTQEFTHPVTNPLILGGIQAGLIDLELSPDNMVTTQVSFFCFGNLIQGVTFPGEALTRLAMPITDNLDAEFKFFFGLTNDSLGYFLPSDEFLQIEGRTTEEAASLDPLIGDKAQAVLTQLILE